MQPQTGRVIQHTHIKLGVYSQHSADQLDLTKSPLEFVRDKFANISQDYQYWRGQLGRYGLSGEAQTPKWLLYLKVKDPVLFLHYWL